MALYKRTGSKYWWMKFTFDGKLTQKSTNVTNKRDALMVESVYRAQLALRKLGITPKPEAPLFSRAVEDFLKWSKLKHSNKPNSYLRKECACQSLKKFFGEKRADQIEVKHIEQYIFWRSKQVSKRTGEAVTNDSINLELLFLKAILKRLVTAKELSENPADSVKRLSSNARTFHVVTREEEMTYLLAAPPALQDFATLMIETGMRPAEIFWLERGNISINKKFLQIENGKTKSSNRKIWLSAKAIKVLQGRLNKFKGKYLFPKDDADFLPPAAYQMNTQHRETIDRISCKFRLYDLRHTFATRALETGTDLLTLASLLGHSNLDQVTRYAHPSEERKSKAIEQMQKGAKAV